MTLGGRFTFKTKKHDQTLDPRCRKGDLYGKVDIQNFSRIVSQKREGLRWPSLFYPLCTLPRYLSEKVSPRKLFEGRRNNSYTAREFFNFRENDYNSAVNIHFWAWSNFNIFANFDPLMANDGTLKSSRPEICFRSSSRGQTQLQK